ncbi:hypothetical protein VUR80DRAFT_10309 [Thermomyces stellatus]
MPRYERRLEAIGHEMEQLNIEEIKAHVLHNHIMPLSRPGTPASDYSSRSSLSYTRMEDLTAVITAIVVQALPNLSRLSRLLNVWATRLVVLRQVTPYLSALQDAEVALQSAWNAIAITAGASGSPRADAGGLTTITRNDFQIMRVVLEKKITGSGRILDYMLDILEGFDDTLPDEWLDRMEAVEKGYGDWVVACEIKIREAEWAAAAKERKSVGGERTEVMQSEDREARQSQQPEGSGKGVVRSEEGEVLTGARDAEAQRPSLLTVPADSSVDSTKSEGTARTTPDAESSEDELAGGVPVHEHLVAQDTPGGAKLTEPGHPVRALAPSPSISPASSVEEDSTEPRLPPLIPMSGVRAGSDSPQLSSAAQARLKFMELDAAARANLASSPSVRPQPRAPSATLRDSPSIPIPSIEEDDEDDRPSTPLTDSFIEGMDDSPCVDGTPSGKEPSQDQLEKQISNILETIPGNFTLETETALINLNPPDFKPPRTAPSSSRNTRPEPLWRSRSNLSSRASTPGFTLAPAYAKNPRPRPKSTQQDIKVYHLSRPSGEAPIKLFIRCVGENGERVMVRVGGGWADLGEYLKDYATHHGRRSTVGNDKVEVRDVPRASRGPTSTPPSRPASALDSPMTPLHVRKTRKSFGADDSRRPPRTPIPTSLERTPPSNSSTQSRSSSRLSWAEDESPMLGLAGPKSKPVEMSEESRAWVASVKEKVRLASGERKVSGTGSEVGGRDGRESVGRDRGRESVGAKDREAFGELGKVGGTTRLFRKGQ